jgi:N-acetyl-gamma-glutamylphosphate reductase
MALPCHTLDMIEHAASSDPTVRELLARHPRVAKVVEGIHPGIDFNVGGWSRSVYIANPEVEQHGLVELMDNNPLVCADTLSVPSPAATMALIALGPLAAASLITERPTFITNAVTEEEDIARSLATTGWDEGVTLVVDPHELDGVVMGSAMAVIAEPEDWDDIDSLYEERFGRSFFVRREEEADWQPSLVKGHPHAVFSLRYTPGEGTGLLTIRVLADRPGKAGAAQLVHAMNVMCGLEESLGIC